ncbi:type II restriction endonuclease [Helicobacter sp. MIT 05-5293]|uniref:Eco57I restriction-modification methylase domain-containing protein n=1 Tax=Helicobacter sp. MIT 05-5293 TaxID=1548149 RepID=UPI0010FF35C6|nr:Eco57I restriction-modification methylase domain-containing protein [Helicobacter sp. MIT 05-5293]TLD82261.1 type II restriction endonuclease [Helicobacter sp. MIT 05-5293]
MSATELETFLSQPYSYAHFRDFITQSFGHHIHIKSEASYNYHEGNIIKSYTQVCEPIMLDSQRNLCVYAFKTRSINAKVGLHKEIASILKTSTFDAVLAVFYEEDSQEFRLSLVSRGYDYEANRQTFSNFRRQSFVLGHEKIKTAKTQLQDFIDKEQKSLESLQKAFSTEPLNKDFYKEIKKVFDVFCENIKAPELNIQNVKEFSIKLLGRILFIRFLKELGIIPNSIFDVQKDYYQKTLIPLFFEVLNTKVDERKSHISNNALFASIPFLNGGLFAPSPLDCCQESAFGTFSRIAIPDYIFKDLFSILENYHFTIDESSPEDTQVSLDPEMLGQIFENLLAEIDPTLDDTTNIRKATGSFYTPRHIVSFMCKNAIAQSLKHKLPDLHASIDSLLQTAKDQSQSISLVIQDKKRILEALNSLKILDLFCGSGAFPMGILHEIISLQEQLGDTRSRYECKLSIIESQIYGVDIQNIATEISRLRCFLSLIVELQSSSNLPPLPNLEFKFVCANSFVKLEDVMDYDGYEKDKKDLKEIRKAYFLPTANKPKLKGQFQAIKNRIFDNLVLSSGDTHPLASYNPFDTPKNAEFFDSELMFGVESFDICIGNPPYISNKGSKVYQKNKPILEKQQGFFDDAYNHAFFSSYELLKPSGVLCLITPKTFWTIQTKSNLRQLILKNTLHFICDSANPFEAAMVDTCITQLSKIPYEKTTDCLFIDARKSFDLPMYYHFKQSLYKESNNLVIFTPNQANLAIYNKYNQKIKSLMQNWWVKIKTSRDIEKNRNALEYYRNSLKPGDVTLLGLITDGGQGLATADNGKYVAYKANSKEALRCKEKRAEKLCKEKRVQRDLGLELTSKKEALAYLESLNESEVQDIFTQAKAKYGRDVWGQGFLYKIIDESLIANVESLSEEEKQEGIESKACYVPYDKGDKNGNRWYLPTPFYIAWSKENVRFLRTNSGKKGNGMPVVRNPQFYFKEGFCWNNVLHYEEGQFIKCRFKESTINDVASMSLYTLCNLPISYFVSVLNSTFMYEYLKTFVNASVNLQINDFRQLPIVIPTAQQLQAFKVIFGKAFRLQKEKFEAYKDNTSDLENLQKELDKEVYALYGLDRHCVC